MIGLSDNKDIYNDLVNSINSVRDTADEHLHDQIDNVYNELNKVKVALDYVQHDTWSLSSRGQFICPSCGGSNHSIDMNNIKSHKHSCDNCGLTLYYPWEL